MHNLHMANGKLFAICQSLVIDDYWDSAEVINTSFYILYRYTIHAFMHGMHRYWREDERRETEDGDPHMLWPQFRLYIRECKYNGGC